jgi:hypothetical protein
MAGGWRRQLQLLLEARRKIGHAMKTRRADGGMAERTHYQWTSFLKSPFTLYQAAVTQELL